MKKIIRNLAVLAIILCISIPVLSLSTKSYKEQDVLNGMLKELNGNFLEGDVNVGGVILDEFLHKNDIYDLGEEIKSKMEIIGERSDPNRMYDNVQGEFYSEEFIYEDGFNQLTIYGYDKDKNLITVMIGSYRDEVSNIEETTLFINLIKGGKRFDISGIIDKIEDVFKKFNKVVETTTCITGTLDGKIKEDLIKKDVINFKKRFKLNIVEEYVDNEIISYTGYTPLIDSFIFSGTKKVNLNLALRYNELENKTYIWIGTPIITTGY